MSDLIAIVKATRKSANSVARQDVEFRKMRQAQRQGDHASALVHQRAYVKARRDYYAAQDVLAANPL